MSARVLVSSIVLVLLVGGWGLWARAVHRPAPFVGSFRPAPSAIDEGGEAEPGSESGQAGPPAVGVAEGPRHATGLSVVPVRSPAHRRRLQGGRTGVPIDSSSSRRQERSDGKPEGEAARPPHLSREHVVATDRSALGSDNDASGDAGLGIPPDAASPSTQATPSQVKEPVLRPPVLLLDPALAYPESGYQVSLDRSSLSPHMRSVATEGRVVLRLLVTLDGRVDRADVTASSGSAELDQAAVTAARNWRFMPATLDGRSIEAWALIPVRFVLR